MIQWGQRGAALATALVAALALAACGGGEDDGAATTRAPGTTEAAAGGGALKVGLVTDTGQLNDRGFNFLAYRGLKRAERELGVQGRVLQSASASEYVPNLTALARQGFDLVVGVGFAQGEAIDKAALRFPDTRFAIIDVDQKSLAHAPKNVVGLLFREQEVGYLAGYLAALAEKRRPGPDVISSVGGMKEPPVDRFIAGYQAGARAAVPGIELLNGYSQDWDDQAKCKELALDQIARGSGVVFQVAGGCGLGALDAAGDRKVWGVGVDADQSFLGPHVLTSAQKRVDRAVYLTIQSIERNAFPGGGNSVFGLKQAGVGLGKISPRFPRADLKRLDGVERRIAAGEIQIPTRVG